MFFCVHDDEDDDESDNADEDDDDGNDRRCSAQLFCPINQLSISLNLFTDNESQKFFFIASS